MTNSPTEALAARIYAHLIGDLVSSGKPFKGRGTAQAEMAFDYARTFQAVLLAQREKK